MNITDNIISYSRIPSLVKAQKKYQQNNHEKTNEISQNWYNRNKDKEEFKEKRKINYLKNKEKLRLLKEQNE